MPGVCDCRRRVLVLILCVLFSAAGPLLRAQDATLAGTILDQAGKPLQSAAVTVKNSSANLVRKATSGPDGRFSVSGLPLGVYTIEASAAGFATSTRTGVQLGAGGAAEVSLTLSVANVAQSITVEASASVAAQLAPSQSSLDARSAKSEISQDYIQNFTSPVSDYTELLNMAPGTFSVNPNGVGLGDSKTYFRGFADGQYTMTFDGIPFNDTNTPTHHSWAFFPAQFTGGVDFDRSPGSASTFGPTNFGGSVNLLSRPVPSDMDIRATASYGSFNTRLLALDLDSGQFGGKDKRSSLQIDLHQMLSDGYQTYNYQKRVAGSMKYQYRLNDKTTITLFTGLIDLWTNTPNTKGPTRAQVAQFGDNYLLSGDPSRADYYGYNFYHVQTDFEYIGINSDLGHGWRLDDKVYTYRYWNKQNYNGTTISKTSGTDKLNGYRKVGDVLSVNKDIYHGVFRTGMWYEWAYTDRYQIPPIRAPGSTPRSPTSTNTTSPTPTSRLPNMSSTRPSGSVSRAA
jgi:iron complex outermembrane recepter protein